MRARSSPGHPGCAPRERGLRQGRRGSGAGRFAEDAGGGIRRGSLRRDRHVDRRRALHARRQHHERGRGESSPWADPELTETAATSSAEHCATPKYPTRDVPTEEFLATEFNLPPESLKEFEGRDQVTIVEISCDGAPWTAFGSLLLEIDAEHAFTPWDGVFFELERTHQSAGDPATLM